MFLLPQGNSFIDKKEFYFSDRTILQAVFLGGEDEAMWIRYAEK